MDYKIEELYKLIKQEAEKVGNSIIIDREKTLKCLKNIDKEINKKYNETLKLWNQSIKLYQDFIKKAPGSQQMQPPQPKPTLPASVDSVKGYIDMFESIDRKKITLFTNFVEKMYLQSIRGVSEIRKKRDAMMAAVSGLIIDTDAGWQGVTGSNDEY